MIGYAVYFIDVLACMLFCLVLALVGARFGREQTVELDLPQMERSAAAGSDLVGREVALLGEGARLRVLLDGEPLGVRELESRLREARPPSIVLRMERSALSDVVAAVHAAGVAEIRLAYEARGGAR